MKAEELLREGKTISETAEMTGLSLYDVKKIKKEKNIHARRGKVERNREIVRLRNEGKTYAEIAEIIKEKYGDVITRQRAYYLYRSYRDDAVSHGGN